MFRLEFGSTRRYCDGMSRRSFLQLGVAGMASVGLPRLLQAKSESAVQTTQRGSFQNLLAMFNTASGPLKDLRVRQAVAEAIDYAGIISALKGSAVAANGFVPNGLIGFDSSITNVTDTIQSVSVTLTNRQGVSSSQSVNLK